MSQAQVEKKPPADENLDQHVEESVDSLAALHRQHHEGSSGLQHGIDRVTDLLGRPLFALSLAAGVAAWILYARRSPEGVHGAAFAWLELSATLAALFVAVLILVTQRRSDQLSERRAQLTLEMAIVADKKTAKIVELLEALRQDSPSIRDRTDAETDAMARPVDPEQILSALEVRDLEAED